MCRKTKPPLSSGSVFHCGPDLTVNFQAANQPLERQMTIGRFAWQSQSDDSRAQGFELWHGSSFGPVSPQPANSSMIADSSTHLWRPQMPEDLPIGAHVAEVKAIIRDGVNSAAGSCLRCAPWKPSHIPKKM